MGEIVNLRRARKAKERQEAENAAAANRIAFGRSRNEKEAERAGRELETRRLDGHRREPDEADGAGKPGSRNE
ncbi:MAG: DUF4169 family protein [Beijerinckiaceae bacterium]